ncbi:MAG: PQQ-binding-like beta-propeller repeat protein [Gemmatales bacterium]
MRKFITSFLFFASLSTLAASDWPQFRGPTAQGTSDASLPTEWSDSKNLKWKAKLPGPGSSSPIVWKDRIFVTCYTGYGERKQGDVGKMDELKRHLLCLNRDDGKLLWTATIEASQPEDNYQGFIRDHGYASSTPVTDGETVWVFFGKSGVFAFDYSGKQLWKASVGTKSSSRRWGSAASPVLYGNLVIINAAEESRTIYGLDKKTGSIVWKAEDPKLELCYMTPLIVKGLEGDEAILSLSGSVWSLNPQDGTTRWKTKTEITGNVSPSLITNDGVLYVNGGFPNILASAISLNDKKHEVLWKSKSSSYVSSPVYHQGHLYVANHTGIARCLNPKTGEAVYDQRLPLKSEGRGGSAIYASPLLAKDKIYVTTRTGGVFVLAAQPEYKLLATNRFADDDSDFNASPAVMGNQLLLRSNQYLYCVGE